MSVEQFTLLFESGYSRVRQAMMGQVSSINTLAILTAQNPNGEQREQGWNKKINKSLEAYLKAGDIGFAKIYGRWEGLDEESYLIPNFPRSQAIQAGVDFGQEAIIWARKIVDDQSNPFMRFEYIDTKSGITGDVRDVVRDVSSGKGYMSDKVLLNDGTELVGRIRDESPSGVTIDVRDAGGSWNRQQIPSENVKNVHREENYSHIDNQRFVIPFFDREFATSQLIFSGKGVFIG
jgi:hypothetical protein